MTPFDRGRPVLEGGWVLTGTRGDGAPIKLVLGQTELSRAYLGVTLGRHAALCERVIDDPGISRRHLRVGIADGELETLLHHHFNRSISAPQPASFSTSRS